MRTCANDWFSDEHEFRQLCGDAQSQSRTEKAQEFAAEMVVKSKQLGLNTPLTFSQLRWLCQLADWELPVRRSVSDDF